MSNTGPASKPDQVSMDEILTSIRQAIGDNQDVHKKSSLSQSKFAPSSSHHEESEDVLELTHPIEETPLDLNNPLKDTCQPRENFSKKTSQESLVSENIFSKAACAFDALSEAVKNKEILEEQQGTGGQRVDDLMKEIMRPYIKNWLDQNLPTIVERLVQKEISRLAQSAVTSSS